QPGTNKFFSAHLLTMPVRSNVKPFFRATCPAIIGQLIESLNAFGVHSDSINSLKKLKVLDFKDSSGTKSDFILFKENNSIPVIEDCSRKKDNLSFTWDDYHTKWFGYEDDFALLRDDVFMKICEDLPVVARNQLGKQRNLWYEELVPRQTEFWFIHLFPDPAITSIEDVLSMIM
ncbi:MAG: hypothetical protein Q8J97_15070, partial [Flavobacteriaceae bacterium]|nr:hypothetical protein [Flavobacteriaceae bacterium]